MEEETSLDGRLDRIENNTTILLKSLDIIISQNTTIASINDIVHDHDNRIKSIENNIVSNSNQKHTKSLVVIYIALGFIYIGTAIHIALPLLG